MQTATQAWLTAAQNAQTRSEVSGTYQPIWLVEIVGINTYFSTRSVSFSRLRQLGDGGLLGTGILLGDYLPTYGLDLAARGGLSSSTIELTDDYSRPQVSGMRVQLLNQEGLLRTLQEALLDNAPLRLRLGFVGLGYDDYLEYWRGVVDSLEDTQEAITLSCIDGAFLYYPSLDQPLSPQYFPATPQANKSRAVPLILGKNTDVETIQISGAAQGTLAVSISSTATALLLTEFGAAFPLSGSISIGSETSVTYASRALLTHPTTGLTTLQLSGLVRSGTPASHAVAEVVTLVTPNYDYLVGYGITDIQVVRGNGTIISPASYTVLTQQAGADVTVLRFTSAPDEPVTIDVNAGNITDDNILINGDFEAGTLAGWTTGAGATTAVGTNSPAPQEGTYRASLEGDEGVYKDLYQDVTTMPGEEYILTFWRQDADSNLLTNGGFETGDLTGWTTSTVASRPAIFQVVDMLEPIQLPDSIHFRAIAADGRYTLYVSQTLGYDQYEGTLFQDLATTIGFTYTLSFAYLSGIMSYQISREDFIRRSVVARVHVSVGTTSDPGSILTETGVPDAFQFFHGVFFLAFTDELNLRDVRNITSLAKSPVYTWVATATTTRISFRCYGTPINDAGDITFGAISVALDAVRVQNASVIETAKLGYQIGTPSDADSIVAENLPAVYVWTEEGVRFQASEATTRITFQSQHTTGIVLASYLDNIRLQRVFTQNYNPIEQIRYIIETFLPQRAIDLASFVAAYDVRILWRFAAVLFNPGESRALLNRMAAQCGCLLIETAQGALKIVARDDTRQTIYGFLRSNIVQGSFSAVPELLDNIYTEVYVWFGARTGGSTQASDFAASTYATAENTTHPLGSVLTGLCANARAIYRRTRRLDIYAEFIQDITTANLLLLYEVQRRTTRRTVITFQTWLDASYVEIGDIIAAEDPRYPEIATIYDYEVVSLSSPTPEQPYTTIRARSERPSAWIGRFDYADITLDTSGFMDHFEV